MPNPKSGPSTDRSWYDDEREEQKANHEELMAKLAAEQADGMAKMAKMEASDLESQLEAMAKKVEKSQKTTGM